MRLARFYFVLFVLVLGIFPCFGMDRNEEALNSNKKIKAMVGELDKKLRQFWEARNPAMIKRSKERPIMMFFYLSNDDRVHYMKIKYPSQEPTDNSQILNFLKELRVSPKLPGKNCRYEFKTTFCGNDIKTLCTTVYPPPRTIDSVPAEIPAEDLEKWFNMK
jgi:hypothetical protein